MSHTIIKTELSIDRSSMLRDRHVGLGLYYNANMENTFPFKHDQQN